MQHTHKKFFIFLGLLLNLAFTACNFSFAQDMASEEILGTNEQKAPAELKDGAYIQKQDDIYLKDFYKPIMLGDVLEQGLRKNHDQLIRNKQNLVLDLAWDDAYYSFWYPQLNLKLKTNDFSVSGIFNNDETSTSTQSVPTGSLGLALEDYTVFNWGKDFLNYLNSKQTYRRGKELLNEQRRELKHNLLKAFFQNMHTKEVEDAYKGKLRHASFIYRLNRERIAVGKITQEQFLQARAKYLMAQEEYQSAKVNAQLADEDLAYLINDPVGTRYLLRENLLYQPLRLKPTESLALAKKTNPEILNSQTEVENTRRSYEIQRRENLPLPKFTLTLGAYSHSFGATTSSTDYANTTSGGTEPEIRGSINATWSIFGEGGFFNGRKTATALINQNIALKRLTKSHHIANSGIRKVYRQVQIYQKKIEILEASLKTMQKKFDVILENYINKKTRFSDFSHALEELTESEVLYSQLKLEHFQAKVNLAEIIGIGDFPGESFEKLAVLKSLGGESNE